MIESYIPWASNSFITASLISLPTALATFLPGTVASSLRTSSLLLQLESWTLNGLSFKT